MKNKKLFLAFILLTFLVFNLLLIISLHPEKVEEETINIKMGESLYVAPYIGDIDGDVSEDWFFFYEKLIDFHEKEKIPLTISFYPASIKDSEEFNDIFKRMYESDYIELMQKGYRGDEVEKKMEQLSFYDQRLIIQEGQNYFKIKMREILGKENVELPISYNQIGGKFNEDTLKAAESLGFRIYFDLFVGDNVVPLESSETFDVTQYSVSFTKTGFPGKETTFSQPEKIISEISGFERSDLIVLTIKGKKVVPLGSHQQDFESKIEENLLDEEKWKIYTQTYKALKKDPNVIFVTSRDIYELRHYPKPFILEMT